MCAIPHEDPGSYGFVVLALDEGFAGDVVLAGHLGRIVLQVISSPTARMNVTVCTHTHTRTTARAHKHGRTRIS
jgi:hypothetical protein